MMILRVVFFIFVVCRQWPEFILRDPLIFFFFFLKCEPRAKDLPYSLIKEKFRMVTTPQKQKPTLPATNHPNAWHPQAPKV
jgi:hypothetical protein